MSFWRMCKISHPQHLTVSHSTILSAQFPHSKWYDLFADPTIADAVMDRVIHNAYIMPLDSKRSLREVMAEKVKKSF